MGTRRNELQIKLHGRLETKPKSNPTKQPTEPREGETSLAKLSIEEDRGANSPAVSILNSSMDTVTEYNLLQQSDVEETIVTSTPKQDKHPSAIPKRKLSGAARRRLKKAKEGLAGETSKVTPSQIPKTTSEVEGSQKKRAHTSDEREIKWTTDKR